MDKNEILRTLRTIMIKDNHISLVDESVIIPEFRKVYPNEFYPVSDNDLSKYILDVLNTCGGLEPEPDDVKKWSEITSEPRTSKEWNDWDKEKQESFKKDIKKLILFVSLWILVLPLSFTLPISYGKGFTFGLWLILTAVIMRINAKRYERFYNKYFVEK